MKEEKFKVIQFIREMIVAIDGQLVNFSKKDIELKNRIRMNTYDLLEIAYQANTIEDIDEKKELIALMIAKIKVIDFLLNLSLQKQLITQKKYIKLIDFLLNMSLQKQLITQKKYIKLGQRIDDIAKYSNGWLKALRPN